MSDFYAPESAKLRESVQHFANRSFASIPQDWAQLASQYHDGQGEVECYAWPMWGTLFRCDDFAPNIARMLCSALPEDSEARTLREFAEEHGLDFAEPEDAEDLTCEDWLEQTREDLLEQWRESYDERADLEASGWQEVGSTGFLAREIDGSLFLGVHGAGYDFHEAHWSALYLALGLRWHISEEDEEDERDTARRLSEDSICGKADCPCS